MEGEAGDSSLATQEVQHLPGLCENLSQKTNKKNSSCDCKN